ncbi:MAG TPA: hypothetical protein VHO03_20675 [Ignavibacteriales bacterium]|nr:hypothetical protein [Ignavibacteriales bacterium]
MKKIVLILFALVFYSSDYLCQQYQGYAERILFYQRPNARSEALGRGQATLHASPYSILDNPAALSFSKGMNLEVSHMNPNYPKETEGYYNTYGISYNSGRYGAFGFNYLTFSVGRPDEEIYFPDRNINRLFMLNFSYQVLTDLSLGVNLNYFFEKEYDLWNNIAPNALNTYYFDLGVLKRFHLDSIGNHDLYLGLSLVNAGYSEVNHRFHNTFYFPTIMHLGTSYEFKTKKMGRYDLMPLKLLLAGEYMDVFETRYFTQIRLGLEAALWEVVKLRIGHYSETLDTRITDGSVTSLNQFTYGAGLEIPLSRLTNIALPLTVNIDFTRLPLPNYDDYSYRDLFGDIRMSGPGFEHFNRKYYIVSININAGI